MKSDVICSSLYLEGHLCLSEHTFMNETLVCVGVLARFFRRTMMLAFSCLEPILENTSRVCR